MIYPESFEKKIGFDVVRQEVSKLCESTPGHAYAAVGLSFSAEIAAVTERLAATAEMLAIVDGGEEFPGLSIADIRSMMRRVAAPGSFFTAEELISLNRALSTAAAVAAFFAAHRSEESATPYPRLDAVASTLLSLPDVIAMIGRTIDRFGDIRDNASPQLADIRRAIASTQAGLGTVMRRVISKAVEGGYLEAGTAAVIRDGRFVLPVPPMHKRKIPGIVHDESATGKTIFIEPAEMVEANNRVRELQLEEKREITRILKEITDAIRPHIDEITTTADTLGHIDFIHAKALYARRIDARLPRVEGRRDIDWYHAEHPVLRQSLINHGKQIVPLDIRLTDRDRILVISGPNAGGKSVCLKTVGIIQYMMQCGLLPPVYENSRMGIFENIFIDIGDDQSIEDDLSTYSSHLRNMRFFLSRGNKSTLILIDEFGGGTEPQIGGAIAQAILKEFNAKRMWGVITTHYQNLKTFAEETPGLINGSMLYDRQQMRPLFRLSIGNPGSSFAIEIARQTGLPREIIDDAQAIVGSDYVKLDRYLLDIARDKRYWENKRESIRQKERKIDEALERYESDADTLREQRRQIIADARSEARRIIDESNATVERTIREIREAQADRERTRLARRQIEEQRRALAADRFADASEPEALRRAPKPKRPKAASKGEQSVAIAAGDYVKFEGQSTVGRVVDTDGRTATVAFGMLKTTVDVGRLRPAQGRPDTGVKAGVATVTNATSDASRSRQLNFKTEIDVRGMRVDEALQAVTYFIDDAIQFSAGRVRILHGTGTGALRQAIRDYLRAVPGVSAYRDEHVQFGGAGITVVDLD